MLFRDEPAAPAAAPATRGARLGEELLVPIRRQLGAAIDAQRDLHDPDLADLGLAQRSHCVLRVLLHPESTWPLIAPMRQPLREKLQRSADRHADYRELGVKFEVRLESAPTSSGPPFAIVVGEDVVFPELPPAAPATFGATGVQTPPLGGRSQRGPASGIATAAVAPVGIATEVAAGIATEVVASEPWRLEVLGANGLATEVYELDTERTRVSVGRGGAQGAQPDIPLACDPTVSAVQLLLRVSGDRESVELQNVGRNRVWVNEQPVEGTPALKGLQKPSVVHAGDVVTLGHRHPLRLRIAGKSDNLIGPATGRGVFTEPASDSLTLGADPNGRS
jgi:hypothetical protein